MPKLLVSLDVAAFVLLALDSAWGFVASLIFDFRDPWSLVNVAVLVPALPILGLLRWYRRTTIALLWVLFLARWVVECFDGNPPKFFIPLEWPIGSLLFAGVVILQIGYVLRESDARRAATD